MKREPENTPHEIKPDLKHDTMEYAASADGDDIVDPGTDDTGEDITAEELEILEGDGIEDQAAALNSVEMDRKVDDDVIFDEKDIEVGYEENLDDDEEE